jgi:hypothetical protein
VRSLIAGGMLAALVPAAQAADVRIPTNLKAGTAADVVVPVIVDPAAGVGSLELVFTYDGAVLQPAAAYRTAATDGFSLLVDLATPGTVALDLAGAPLGATGAAEVVWVLFDVVGPSGSLSDFVWTSAVLNGGALASSTTNGKVTVAAAASVVDMPDNAQGIPGGTLVVPIGTSDAAGAEAFDLIARFNPAVIVPTSVAKTPLTEPMNMTSFLGIPGEARVTLWATQAIPSGSGPLVNITFDLVGSLGDVTPLDVSRGSINENQIPTAIDDGLLLLCDAAAPAGLSTLGVDKGPAGEAALAWSAVAGATGYDVVRGDLAVLAASNGDFTAAVVACLAEDQPSPALDDTDAPAEGTGFWYLVRGTNCGGGASYDSGGPGQVGSRDAELDASLAACF